MSTPIEPPVHRSPAGPEPHAGHRTAPASVHRPLLRGLVAYLVIAAVIGGLAGLVWNGVTDLPTYTIGSDGSASITERGLASVFSSDASYALIGLLTGALLGLLAWWAFRRRGALVVAIAAAGALLAALACWWVGVLVGPDGFAIRISGAKAGDVVPIDLALRTWTPALVWPFAALIPVLVLSMLRWDAVERTRRPRPRVRSADPAPAAGDAHAAERAPSAPQDPAD